MNGPAHYREAERLIEIANRDELGSPEERYRVAAAQVHATLALVAATVGSRRRDPAREEFGHSDADRDFYEVTQ